MSRLDSQHITLVEGEDTAHVRVSDDGTATFALGTTTVVVPPSIARTVKAELVAGMHRAAEAQIVRPHVPAWDRNERGTW